MVPFSKKHKLSSIYGIKKIIVTLVSKRRTMQTSNDNNNTPKKFGNAIISNEVRDYGNDPFFVKKADDSKRFLEEHGFPEDLLKYQIEKYNKLLKKGS
jgi:hypothetical protein